MQNTADEELYLQSSILDESCSKPDLSTDLSLIELPNTTPPSLVVAPKANRRVIIPVKRLLPNSPLLQRPPPVQVGERGTITKEPSEINNHLECSLCSSSLADNRANAM